MTIPYLDWVAMGLTLGQMYLLGHHRVLGWPVGLVGSALWTVWALDGGLWSIVTINTILGFLAVRGWYGWTRGPRAAAPTRPQAADGGRGQP